MDIFWISLGTKGCTTSASKKLSDMRLLDVIDIRFHNHSFEKLGVEPGDIVLLHHFDKTAKERYAIHKIGLVLLSTDKMTISIIKSIDKEIISKEMCKNFFPYNPENYTSHFFQKVDIKYQEEIIEQIFGSV